MMNQPLVRPAISCGGGGVGGVCPLDSREGGQELKTSKHSCNKDKRLATRNG